MNQKQTQRLAEMGGRVTSASEFLELSPAEEKLVETGLALSNLVKKTRLERGLSQTDLAKMLGTKQPNIARLEQATGTSFDLLFKALYEMGITPSGIAKALEATENDSVEAKRYAREPVTAG